MEGLIVTSSSGWKTTAYALLLGNGDNLAFKESQQFLFTPVLGVGISKMIMCSYILALFFFQLLNCINTHTTDYLASRVDIAVVLAGQSNDGVLELVLVMYCKYSCP